ncbi:MAG TPA: hypothetical protein VK932_07150 [Kofleriaceae bacterium]|nr:hypothetical protein [Kofleriaceae bacterium]
MKTTTIGDLISGLVDAYERQYHDHELATVKTALVVDELLRARSRRTAAKVIGAAGARRSSRKAA